MAGFGGAVKLTGESEYRKALNQINATLKQTSADLKLVTTQYDTNDKSMFALNQQMDAYNKKLDAQKALVKTLSDELKTMNNQQAESKAKHEALVKSLDAESEKLKEIEKTSGKTSDEYKEQAKVVSDLATEVNKSSKTLDSNEEAINKVQLALTKATTELRSTEKSAKGMDEELKAASDDSNDLSKEVKKAGDEAEKAGNGGFTVFKGVLADLTSSAIKSAISGLASLGKAAVDLGKSAISSYADYEQLVGGVETLFGAGGLSLQEYADSVGQTADEAKAKYEELQKAEDIVMRNSQDAYKNVGMSANEYMETVTAFSAALVNSLGGDTVAAANAADIALQDISDNANKMGTDIGSVTAAFQGLAKGQYQLLDNLKLGYGGSQAELERLLADAEKFSGVKYNIKNLNDVYSAIHVIQQEMGITGTTANEAASTIAGSTSMMKASWQNLLTGIADDGADFEGLVNNFVNSVLTVGDNILPRVEVVINGVSNLATQLLTKLLPQILNKIPSLISNVLPQLLTATKSVLESVLAVLPQVLPVLTKLLNDSVKLIISMLPEFVSSGIDILLALIDGITETIPQLIEMLPTIIEDTVNTLLSKLPDIIKTGMALLRGIVDGILKALPELIKMLPTIINDTCQTLIDNLPEVLSTGMDILFALIDGIIEALPDLVEMVPTIIYKVTQTLAENWPKIQEKGRELISKLLDGIGEKFHKLTEKAKEIKDTIVNKAEEIPGKLKEVGYKLVSGIWDGISGSANWLAQKVKGFCDGIVNDIKDFFSIFSPSHLMRDEIGKQLALGIGVGFSDEMDDVSKQMEDAVPTSFDTSVDLNTDVSGVGSMYGGVVPYSELVRAFREALEGVDVELDDVKVGKFVTKTVTAAIYT